MRKSLYPQMEPESRGTVPPAIERCVSHITAHGGSVGSLCVPVCLPTRVSDRLCFSGLNVEGVYRRCGLATKVSRLVEALLTSPKTAPLESDEQGVLDAGSALKQYVRQQDSLFPDRERQQWLHAASKCAAARVCVITSWALTDRSGVVLIQLRHFSARLDLCSTDTVYLVAISAENSRFSAYKRLIRQLPDDNRATLNALFGHFYM